MKKSLSMLVGAACFLSSLLPFKAFCQEPALDDVHSLERQNKETEMSFYISPYFDVKIGTFYDNKKIIYEDDRTNISMNLRVLAYLPNLDNQTIRMVMGIDKVEGRYSNYDDPHLGRVDVFVIYPEEQNTEIWRRAAFCLVERMRDCQIGKFNVTNIEEREYFDMTEKIGNLTVKFSSEFMKLPADVFERVKAYVKVLSEDYKKEDLEMRFGINYMDPIRIEKISIPLWIPSAFDIYEIKEWIVDISWKSSGKKVPYLIYYEIDPLVTVSKEEIERRLNKKLPSLESVFDLGISGWELFELLNKSLGVECGEINTYYYLHKD